MVCSDTIADLLTRIRNSKKARHRYVNVPYSKLSVAIIEVLKVKGYVTNYLTNEKNYLVRIFLKYKRKTQEPCIHSLIRMSKPGKRTYVGYQDIPKVLSGLGLVIISTPLGVVDGETARRKKVGGELLCLIW